VSPDVRVDLVDGRYELMLEDAGLPRVHLNRYYLKRLSQPDLDPATREYIQKKIESARWLLEAIEQRRATLQRVTMRIIEAQKEFMEKGISQLRPLKMQEVADALGIHVSTVSRAIAKKYIQCPQGIYPLKFFFTGGVETASGDVESWDSIRQKLQEIVDGEDKTNPLSDEEIVKAFDKQGIEIARRTVTKYRKQMGIPSSRGRKEY
jgi:RNA polymerase sigma-54 factor